MTIQTPDDRTPQAVEQNHPARVEAYEDALRAIAAATLRARARTGPMGQLREEDGSAYLTDVEGTLSALIALGYVPQADPYRRSRPLT